MTYLGEPLAGDQKNDPLGSGYKQIPDVEG